MSETAAERMQRLQREMEQARREMANCNHDYDEPIYDPDQEEVAQFSHYEGHGSDPTPVYNRSYKDKPRWSRTCKVCGHKQYTYEQVRTGPLKPKFN